MQFVFVGDGPYRATLEKITTGRAVTILNQIQHVSNSTAVALSRLLELTLNVMQSDKLSRIYATADVFFSPSESETLGQVFRESLSCGVPAVGCNAAGVPEAIDNVRKNSVLT